MTLEHGCRRSEKSDQMTAVSSQHSKVNNQVRRILKGDVRTLASLMSAIENRDPSVKAVLKALYARTGKAHSIGVTGAAGTGKSSLIDRMTSEYRQRNKSVGILAVDPSSQFSSGALLGDRIRMRDHYLDGEVFIRSFATRGGSGGVCAAIREAVHLLDAAGKDTIFVESIGVGQDQLEIAALTHMVIVVLTPQMGDEIQSMKAGLLEIADIIVVNKSDLPGAEETVQQLRALFEDSAIPILAASLCDNDSIHALVEVIEARRFESLRNGDDQKQRLNLCRQEILSLLREKWLARLAAKIGADSIEHEVKRTAERLTDPYSAVEAIAKKARL